MRLFHTSILGCCTETLSDAASVAGMWLAPFVAESCKSRQPKRLEKESSAKWWQKMA